MKHFDQLLEEDIAAHEGRHDDLIYQTPALYRLLVSLLDDPRLPLRLRPLGIAAIALTVMAIFAFTLWISFFPAFSAEDEESELLPDEEAWEGKNSSHQRKRNSRKR